MCVRASYASYAKRKRDLPGYTFPAAMLLSSLLFQPMRMSASEADCDCDEPEEAEEPAAGRKASFWPAARGAALERRLGLTPHFVWLGTSLRTRKFTLPVLWVVVQWLLPLRMPIRSVSTHGYQLSNSTFCRFGSGV